MERNQKAFQSKATAKEEITLRTVSIARDFLAVIFASPELSLSYHSSGSIYLQS
jgi:hypothetical protein